MAVLMSIGTIVGAVDGVPLGADEGAEDGTVDDVFDGDEVGAVLMPVGVSGSPMTYMHEGSQYIVTAVSGGGNVGELLAYRLLD